MKKDIQDIRRSIETKHEGKGVDRHVVALCPACGQTTHVDVRHSERIAENLARDVIVEHYQNAHPELIEDRSTSYYSLGLTPGKGYKIHVPANDVLSFRYWAFSPDTPEAERKRYSLQDTVEERSPDGGSFFFIGKDLDEDEILNFICHWVIRD